MKLLTFFLCFFVFAAVAQTEFPKEIEGVVLHVNDSLPISYVKVFNSVTQKGVITNASGKFKIVINAWSDTLVISQIGLKTKRITLKENQLFYTIELSENVQLLEEISVTIADDPLLYELIQDCKKNKFFKPLQAKAYYELKSYLDTTQIELVESYFNAELYGYNLNSLKIKAGRLAILPLNNRVFISQSSSKALKMKKIVEEDAFFPKTALDVSLKQLKKEFRLVLKQRYLDEKFDSIYVVQYYPKMKDNTYFKGKIWLNVSDLKIEKIEMESDQCAIYPFLPLFKTDSIENVAMRITKTFETYKDKMFFKHIDFSYTIQYHSRVKEEGERKYTIKTNAVLYAYDFGESFRLPNYDLKSDLSDYRKISAMPYNAFFWKYNDEYKMSDDNAANERFFKDLNVLTNVELFGSKATKWINNPRSKEKYWRLSQTSFFEHPYVQWSTNRILLKNIVGDTSFYTEKEKNNPWYNLSVKIFSDYNVYNDSIHILSATMMDPYETICTYPLDRNINCFVNMYFDLTEIERQKWQESYSKKPMTFDEYRDSYLKLNNNIGYRQMKFLKIAERGYNVPMLKYWNDLILEKLKIDNLKLFGLKE